MLATTDDVPFVKTSLCTVDQLGRADLVFSDIAAVRSVAELDSAVAIAVNDVCAFEPLLDVCDKQSSVTEMPVLVDPVVTPMLSTLKYIEVKINDASFCSKSCPALCDSGSEICVINKSVLDDHPYNACGKIRLRGIVGTPVEADLVNFTISLTDDDDCRISTLCAVSDQVNEPIILTREIVDELFHQSNHAISSANPTVVLSNACAANNSLACAPESTLDQGNADFLDPEDDNVEVSDLGRASVQSLRQEQLSDEALAGSWDMAKQGKGNFFVRDGLLFRHERLFGQTHENLVVPESRLNHVLKLAHDTCGAHLGMKKTTDRIHLSGLTWPTLTSSCKQYTASCQVCQKRARVTCFDRVPIEAIPRASEVFSHWFMDCIGPLFPSQKVEYNCCLIIVDLASR